MISELHNFTFLQYNDLIGILYVLNRCAITTTVFPLKN